MKQYIQSLYFWAFAFILLGCKKETLKASDFSTQAKITILNPNAGDTLQSGVSFSIDGLIHSADFLNGYQLQIWKESELLYHQNYATQNSQYTVHEHPVLYVQDTSVLKLVIRVNLNLQYDEATFTRNFVLIP